MSTQQPQIMEQRSTSAMDSQAEHRRVLMQIELLLLTGEISDAVIAGALMEAAENTRRLLALLEATA